jgi:hypothetical protein
MKMTIPPDLKIVMRKYLRPEVNSKKSFDNLLMMNQALLALDAQQLYA